MANDGQQQRARKFHLSTDGWAVLTALVLAALVKIGWLPRIPW